MQQQHFRKQHFVRFLDSCLPKENHMFLIILSSIVQKERLQKERVATDVNTRAHADAPCAQHVCFEWKSGFRAVMCVWTTLSQHHTMDEH